MGAVTVVVGPPCAGKSTWIRGQRADGDVVVDFDAMTSALGSTAPYAAPDAIRDVAFAARSAAIDRILKGVDAPAWIIHTSPWPGQLERYREAGAELVVLDPGMDVCLARAETDGRPEGTSEAIRQWYDDPPPTDARKGGRRTMRIKSCPVHIKAAGINEGTEDGVFEAIVAAYNLDSVGDKIAPGAFEATLAEWKGRGDPIPVLWSHMSHDPEYHIGFVEEAEERPEGLWVKARLDLDEGSKAEKVYKLLKGRRVTQFSFAYDVDEGSWIDQKDGQGYYELRKLKLYEVGPTLIGANQATELLDVKGNLAVAPDAVLTAEQWHAVASAARRKAGRTLSAKNEERVREIARLSQELLESVASAAADSAEDDEKATSAPPENASPQEPAAKEAPARPGPASLRLHTDLAFLASEVSALTG